MRRFTSMTALLLALALCLCACSGREPSAAQNAGVNLPVPPAAESIQFLGEQMLSSETALTLHYASENSLSLGTMVRSIRLKEHESLIDAALNELLSSAALNGSVEAELLGMEAGSGVITVNLSIEAGVNRSDQDYLLLCSSIANTLLEIDGVQAVNLLTGGSSDPLCGLPLGVFTEAQDNIAALYAQTQTEADRFPSDGAAITRNALLYFPSQDGRYLLPEVRQLRFEDEDYASVLIAALTEGPLARACCFSPLSENLNLLEELPVQHVTEAGQRIIELNFSPMLGEYLAFAGVESWQLYGSLVLSLCSFVPEVDAVQIRIDGELLQDCLMNGRVLHFGNGMLKRSDFDSAIGSSAVLHFADDNGRLVPVETAMGQSAAASPLQLLRSLADTPAPEGLASAFPDGVTGADILGVRVENRTAAVNLSAAFYARCQGLSARQERQLIYAMVNTLTGLDQIGAISFLVEGRQLPFLSQDIYLKTPLLPDPGLVQSE